MDGESVRFPVISGSSRDRSSLGLRDADRVEPECLSEAEMRRREHENIFAVLQIQKASWKVKDVDGAARAFWG
jgi:hypothetical protein